MASLYLRAHSLTATPFASTDGAAQYIAGIRFNHTFCGYKFCSFRIILLSASFLAKTKERVETQLL